MFTTRRHYTLYLYELGFNLRKVYNPYTTQRLVYIIHPQMSRQTAIFFDFFKDLEVLIIIYQICNF